MALSEDQRALLRLLIAGDTYGQVADLLGTTPAEVRSRARAALGQLEAGPRDELSAEAVRARLEVLEGSSPEPEPAPVGRESRWVLWAAAGAAALAVAVVFIVLGTGGGGTGGQTTTGTSPGDREDVVPIRLAPVGGSRASGTIAVVRVADQPAVDLAIRGLRPTGAGESYVLWFVGSGGRSLPIGFHSVGADGRLTGRTQIPAAAIGLLPNFDLAELTLADRRATAAAVQQAAQSDALPRVVGTPVLQGPLR